MNIETLNYIITPVLGAMAGYITNDYAINMLFKSYTPLKIGGIIPKTREEFIENVSTLVEQELITSDKIDEIINSDDFKHSFNTIIEDFFNKGILEVLGTDKNIGDVASFSTDIDNFFEENQDAFNKHFEKIYSQYLAPLELKDFANDEQILHICKNLYDLTIDELFTSDTINSTDIIEELYPSDDDINCMLKSIIQHSDISSLLNKIIKNNFSDIVNSISYDRTKINDFIEEKISEIIKDLPPFSNKLDNEFSRLVLNAFNAAEEKSSKSMVYSMGRSTVESKLETFKISELIENNLTSENISKVANIITNEIVNKIQTLKYEDVDFSGLYRSASTNLVDYLMENFVQNNVFTYDIKKKAIENFKPYFKKYLLDNKNTFVKTIYAKAKTVIDSKNIADITSVTEISSITYNTIISSVSKVKNQNICDTIAKLSEIDGIYEGISNQLIKLLSNNLTPVLKTFIRNLCLTNFNKLNDEELCDMAKSFMGNNLKPLMYFGGGLGLLSGAGLAAVKSNPNILTDVSVESILTYAFVGFITNAIAITMLFRPYNKIPVLSKLPIARHFSIGYIPKHKDIMAESMSTSINKYLLSKESISELFDIYENDLFFKLTDLVSEDDYAIITNFVKEHKYTIIDFSYNKLLELAKNDDLISKLIEKIASINLTSFNTRDNNLEDNICSLIKPRIIETINKYIKSDNLTSNITSVCWNKLTDEKSANFIAEKIYSGINETKLISKANNFIDDYDISDFIMNYILDFVENADKYCVKLIDKYYEDITNKIVTEITSSLNPFSKMAFNVAGGQTVIIEVLDELLYTQIPKYIANKKDVLIDCSKNMLSDKFKGTRLSDFNTKLDIIPKNILSNDSIKEYIYFANNNLKHNKTYIYETMEGIINSKINTIDLYNIINSQNVDLMIDNMVNKICSEKLETIIDLDLLNNNILHIRNTLLESTDFTKDMKCISSDIIENLIDNNLSFLSNDTKNQIVSTTVKSGIVSVRENSSILLSNIEFDKIAREQLIEMDSRKIHKMFKSFAGKYFRRLKLYGVFGGIFGINAVAGLGLSALYFIKNIVNKFKK